MADIPSKEFPVWDLLPKKETGVFSWLSKHESYDGRNTVIAILDSGVDPAASGLHKTSTGEVKVIERFDCSGSGDVDTSKFATAVDGTITGITGRILTLPEKWNNPSGKWRIGVVYPFSLYPTKLTERLIEHRKTHKWDPGHRVAFARANADMAAFLAKQSPNSTLTHEEKMEKEELEARVEALQTVEKKYTDLGPTYDCVLFHDGDSWRACIDTSEEGDLSSGPVLGEYTHTHEHAQLTLLDEMTISINVHSDGDVLEIVGMCSTHGTHVAAIAAGNFPSEPDKNGIAPGAKIVSLTVGDSRIGGMETGTAIIRACIKVMELTKKYKIDVINMSYGEHAHWSNAGCIGEIMCEVVNRYGVSWVVSAGNNGPALCTVGAPPDIEQPILIGVGAYVSPEMMSAAYSMRERIPGTAYSWSSRGPTKDGAAGVCVCAPGGAVASVARFTLRSCQLMNGTSMAAPHVAGAVSILISGLKAKNIPYSPYSVKRAIENSATHLSHVEPWAQGCGLLNVERAFENLVSYHDQPERDVTFLISCGSSNSKGVLLRPKTNDGPVDVMVTVDPQFLNSHEDMEGTAVIGMQINFSMRLCLTVDAEWVSIPRYLDMMNAGRPIAVKINTSGLPPGPHFCSIKAYDVTCVSKGPVFRVPITVFQPEPLNHYSSGPPTLTAKEVFFKPASIKRHFVIPPPDSTWAVVKMTTTNNDTTGRFLIHTMQILPRMSCKIYETQKLVSFTSDGPMLLPFRVYGGVTLEVVLAKYWANIGNMSVDYQVEFHGIKPDFGRELAFHGAAGLHTVMLTALRTEEVAPSIILKHSESVLRPTDSKIKPLGDRDTIPPFRTIYQLVNTYTFHIAKATEVTPEVAPLCHMLYESEFGSQMWFIYNVNKQLMGVGDAYPAKYIVKLDKGDYTMKLCVRSDQRVLLEKLQELPVLLAQKLAQQITIDVYASQGLALKSGKKLANTSVKSGAFLPIYLAAVPSEKISRSNMTVGQTLTGCATFAKDELGRRADTYDVQYVLPELPRRTNGKDKERKKDDEFAEALRDFKAGWMAKLEGDPLEKLYSELVEENPDWSGVHSAYLTSIDPPTDHKKLPRVTVSDINPELCDKIVAIADKLLSDKDRTKLLSYFAIKQDARPDADKIKQEQESRRGHMLDALSRRGVALCWLHAVRGGDDIRSALLQNMTNTLQLVDITDTKVIHYGIWHWFALKQWGRAIKLLHKLQEERPSKEIDERLIDAYQQLEWRHLVVSTTKSIPARFPNDFRMI